MPKNGYKQSSEHRSRISLSLIGRELSSEHIQKNRENGFRKGTTLWVGKKHTEESKKKMRYAHLGKNLSEKTKKKISTTRLGIPENSDKIYIESLKKGKKRKSDMVYAVGRRKIVRRERRMADPRYRLDCNVSSTISNSLQEKKDWREWESLVGYGLNDLMTHLESLFDENMTWDNYGSYWHVDHIKPKSLFNYEYPEDIEFKECWQLSNLQPLEKIENIKKGNRFKVEIKKENPAI